MEVFRLPRFLLAVLVGQIYVGHLVTMLPFHMTLCVEGLLGGVRTMYHS